MFFSECNVNVVVVIICSAATFCCGSRFYSTDTAGKQEDMSELLQSVLEDATEEERGAVLVAKENVKSFLANDAYTGNAGGFIGEGLNAITAFATMDYSQEPGALVKAIGDALVPIIALGLSLIPGVGPIISGVFTGLWGLFSGLFGGGEEESQESKMEKMINDAIEKSELRTDKKLQKLLTGSIHGELTRNKYICDKYMIVAGNFSKNYKNVEKVNDTYRLEMIMFLDNCDNFLKDTAEAFNHPEFAEVLWVPSAMTTLTRIGFLSDIITYGHALRISDKIMKNFYRELKQDIKRHYSLHSQGMIQRLKNIEKHTGLNGEEMTACKMQSELLYFDRGLYPYGIPKKYTVPGGRMSKTIPESVFEMGKDLEGRLKNYTHIQIIADGTYKVDFGNTERDIILNCYMGLTIQKLNHIEFYLEQVKYKSGYSYTIRVLYFTKLENLTTSNNKAVKQQPENKIKGEIKVSSGNHIEVKIREEPDESKRGVLFYADATFIFVDNCRQLSINENGEYEPCLNYTTGYGIEGHFVIDELGTLNINGDNDIGSFKATSSSQPVIWFVGVEFIVRNIIPDPKKQ